MAQKGQGDVGGKEAFAEGGEDLQVLAGLRVTSKAVERVSETTGQQIEEQNQWIWATAEEHFPEASEIVNLYQAREHLAKVAKLVYGVQASKSQAWLSARREELDEGKVEAVVAAMGRAQLHDRGAREEVQTEMEYFRGNAERMRYAKFRRQDLFVGSGVVEAGCKTIFGQRLKLSGMHWTVSGANAIIALRCCQMSGRWEEFWESRVAD
jgi:hypothetical protein